MSFETMGEFQKALGELVAKTNGRKRRPSRARRNMAIEFAGRKFDTVEELVAYERMLGAKPAVAAEAEPKLFATGGKVKRAAGTPYKQQARQIMRAVGGMHALASNSHDTPREALARMGLTDKKAVEVLMAFEDAGIPTDLEANQRDREMAKKALAILQGVLGAKSNTAYMNWTSYPQYAYDAFWRNNPDPRMGKRKGKKARKNGHDAVIAKFVPDPLVTNAGPYTPHIYPYGVGGYPGCYAVKNGRVSELERHRAAREGKTLSGGTAWPVHDIQHAKLALQYMSAGFGGDRWRSQYPKMIRKLAKLWPIEDERNRDIWTYYRQHRHQIAAYAPDVPTIARLRGVA